jgi:alkyl hydroperoxide reductase subunit AhpF
MKREDLLKLYTSGTDYGEFLESNSGFYKEDILSFKSKVILEACLVEAIKSLDQTKYFLAVAEPWCENCVINVTMLELAAAINNNIKYKIVAQSEFENLSKLFTEADIKEMPLIIEISNTGEVLYKYSEKPEILKRIETSSPVMRTAMKKKYKDGGLAEEIVREILKL